MTGDTLIMCSCGSEVLSVSKWDDLTCVDMYFSPRTHGERWRTALSILFRGRSPYSGVVLDAEGLDALRKALNDEQG